MNKYTNYSLYSPGQHPRAVQRRIGAKETKEHAVMVDTFHLLMVGGGTGDRFIIMVKEDRLSNEQRLDLEVVKRKYKNVMDIITFDNLLRRLSFIIEQIRGT